MVNIFTLATLFCYCKATRLVKWRSENNMTLNYCKCYQHTLTRKVEVLIITYCILNHILSKVDSIRDLGIVIDAKLNFLQHIDRIVAQAFRMSCLIIRSTKKIKNPQRMPVLFLSLSMSIVEYYSIVVTLSTKYIPIVLTSWACTKKILHHVCYADWVLDAHTHYVDQLSKYKELSLSNRPGYARSVFLT